MRIIKKLAAACAVTLAISMLSACGKDSLAELPQDTGSPNAGKNPFGVVDDLNEAIFRTCSHSRSTLVLQQIFPSTASKLLDVHKVRRRRFSLSSKKFALQSKRFGL